MPFGKYKGKDLLFIGTFDPPYILWLCNKAQLREPLKTAVTEFSKTQLFRDSLYDYEMAKENQFYEKDWMWK